MRPCREVYSPTAATHPLKETLGQLKHPTQLCQSHIYSLKHTPCFSPQEQTAIHKPPQSLLSRVMIYDRTQMASHRLQSGPGKRGWEEFSIRATGAMAHCLQHTRTQTQGTAKHPLITSVLIKGSTILSPLSVLFTAAGVSDESAEWRRAGRVWLNVSVCNNM